MTTTSTLSADAATVTLTVRSTRATWSEEFDIGRLPGRLALYRALDALPDAEPAQLHQDRQDHDRAGARL